MPAQRNLLRALGRQPGLHFVILGGALFLLRSGLAAPPAPAPASVSEPVPEAIAEPAPPTDDELLYREALRIGLDRELPARRRLIQNMRFLLADAEARDDELYRQAREIGFHRTDPVVRRYMVERMRLLARAGRGPEVFTESELRRYLRQHRERFSIPTFVRLTHVFLSRGRRGATIAAQAHRLLETLRADRVPPAAAPAFGDPLPLGYHTGMVAASDLERIYGTGFAAEVTSLPVGAWSGPVESVQGLHLVWIHEAREAAPARLAEVRSQVVLALAEQRAEARLEEFLRRLRERSAVAKVAR